MTNNAKAYLMAAMILLALVVTHYAEANSGSGGQCGAAPMAPTGTTPVCVCNQSGGNCHWIFIRTN